MSDSTTAAPEVSNGATQTEPESIDDAWSVLEPLTERERAFVLAAVQGKSWSECGDACDITTDWGLVRMLGRVRVRQALSTLAPLVMALDAKRGALLMMPSAARRLAGTLDDGTDAQALQAIKETFAAAGITTRQTDRLTAGLMDVLQAAERRLSARTVDAEVVKTPELPAPVSDSESPTPIGIATIPDAAGSSVQVAPATGAAKRSGRRGRRGTKPSP